MAENHCLTGGERDRVVALVQASWEINSHRTLYLWLQGPLQELLPHEILVAAWGDYSGGPLYYDVISGLPGVRTRKIPDEALTRLLKRLFAFWEGNGCTPSLVGVDDRNDLLEGVGSGEAAKYLCDIKSVLVHAIKDFRWRHVCLYALLSRSQPDAARACAMLNALLPHIDASLRKVPHLPEQVPSAPPIGDAAGGDPGSIPGITPREAEIMKLVRVGKTNAEIGIILDISVFTVKNHLQHIFRKLNVNNRAQAVSECQSGSVDPGGRGQ